jgi:hypothetical protein
MMEYSRTQPKEGQGDEMAMCKKHNKPKTEIWNERQARGGSLMRVGCVDCKAAARNAPPRSKKPPMNSYNPWHQRRPF